MSITAVSAVVSSFSGLRALAMATGWPSGLALLLPGTVDAYAMTATRVWLSAATGSARPRRFARWNAIGAISLSLLGNATWHLVAAGVMGISWPIVVIVGAVPPAVLGLLSHLAVLRGQDEEDEASSGGTEPDDGQDDEAADASSQLLEAARMADATYRAEHGKAITRDELRKRLHVSTERASEILRLLRAFQESESGS